MSDEAKTRVVNIKTNQHFDVYIGRAGQGHDGYFGNPFGRDLTASRDIILELYRTYFYERLKTDNVFAGRVEALRGKVLGCFCKPLPCHGDIIAEYVNSLEIEP